MIWHDAHLVATAYPDPEFVDLDVCKWEDLGLVPMEDGQWKDLCVVDQFRGPTLPCEWIEFDRAQQCVWLKGSERGEIVVPGIAEIGDKAVCVPAAALDEADIRPVRRRPWWKLW